MAEDADIKRLRNKRGCYKGAITRVETFVNSAAFSEASEIMLQERRNRLLCAFKDYEEVNADILFLDANDIEDITSVEEKYFTVLAKLNQALKDLKETESTKPVSDNSSSNLPTIDIPTFDGKDFTKFKSFMDLFDALIHTNKGLTDVQKLFYLRKYLTEDALSVIINLPVVNESYAEALTLLKKRYENKSRLISNHINVILELPVIQNGTASALRSLISDVQQQLHTLKNLGEEVDKWDRLLISILSKKLDLHTNRVYHLDRVDLDKLPTMNEFISFLERRAKALEDSSPMVNNENVHKPSHSKASSTKATYVVSNISRKILCGFCEKQSHPLFTCPKFKLAPVKGRLKFIEDTNRCQVCLNSHPGIKCRFAFKCRLCKQKSHNTLLHQKQPHDNGGNIITSNFVVCQDENQLDKKMPEEPVKVSSDLDKTEQSFQGLVKLKDNEFNVDMLLTKPAEEFSEALQRFLSLENNMKKDHKCYAKYKEFLQDFYNVWHRDRNRYKWKHDNMNLKKGDLVIVELSDVAPMKLPMGHIVKVLPGPDGKIKS